MYGAVSLKLMMGHLKVILIDWPGVPVDSLAHLCDEVGGSFGEEVRLSLVVVIFILGDGVVFIRSAGKADGSKD